MRFHSSLNRHSLLRCDTLQDSVDGKKDADEEEEDERNISDLLVDQLEFADVIILNKTDLVHKDRLRCLEAFVTTLNPGAKLIPAHESKVLVKMPVIPQCLLL